MRRFRSRKINSGARQDNQIDTAVFGAAIGSVIASHGVELGIACSRNSPRGDNLQIDKEARDASGAGRRELPIGVEFRGVNRNVVSVALNAQVIRRMTQRGGNLAQGGKRFGLRSG